MSWRPSSQHRYRARFHRVLRYLDAHLHEPVSLERLSRVASLSKYHFQRQFSAFLGMGVSRYVQLVRLKRASQQLAFRPLSITTIALASGYQGSESFARAFKRNLGQSPSDFRRAPRWRDWHVTYEKLGASRSLHITPTPKRGEVRIVDFPATPVAVLEHRGDPQLIGESIRRFIAWRRAHRLPPQSSATFNILYDDPTTTNAADFRLDLCAAFEGNLPSDAGVVAKMLPAGRAAVLRHVGSEDTLAQSIVYLYAQWLPHSDEQLRDFPLYLQRVRFFPDVPEHEAVVDIFLPLRERAP